MKIYLFFSNFQIIIRLIFWIKDVSVIADKYCEPNLVDLCLQKFERSLNKTNVAALYELTLERKLEVSEFFLKNLFSFEK